MTARDFLPNRIIGMTDRVDFPDLGLTDVPAKIDTGALTSALHCHDVWLVQSETHSILHFRTIDQHGQVSRPFTRNQYSQRMIRNSFGVAELRYVIELRLVLFGEIIQTEFSLADRQQLRFPVLLGRRLLRNRFVVDVAQKNLSYAAKQQDRQQQKTSSTNSTDGPSA
jgi:hypothetical protein